MFDVVAKNQGDLTSVIVTVHIIHGKVGQGSVKAVEVHRNAKTADGTSRVPCRGRKYVIAKEDRRALRV